MSQGQRNQVTRSTQGQRTILTNLTFFIRKLIKTLLKRTKGQRTRSLYIFFSFQKLWIFRSQIPNIKFVDGGERMITTMRNI